MLRSAVTLWHLRRRNAPHEADLRSPGTRHIVNINYGVLGRVGTMAGWYAARRPNMSSKLVIALALLAFALVAAIPIALIVGLVLMLLGHVIGGLALFGGSILAATAAVVLASVTGVRHLRGVVRGMITEHARHHRAQLPGLPAGPGRLHLHRLRPDVNVGGLG